MARYSSSGPRFSDYREIRARFDSISTAGVPIKAGEIIGYSKRFGTVAAAEWDKWSRENAAADQDEAMIRAACGDCGSDYGQCW